MRLRIEPRQEVAAPVGPDGFPDSHLPAFEMERQRRRNWCWAAIAASLARHAGHCGWTQETVVRQTLKLSADLPEADLPDVAARLADALAVVGCYGHWSPGRPSLARVLEEISAARPVAMRLRGRDGGSHFVLVTGYLDRGRDVRVDDPLHGRSLQRFDTFPDGYRGRPAWWAETYWIDFQPEY
jgi:hypothetical protein